MVKLWSKTAGNRADIFLLMDFPLAIFFEKHVDRINRRHDTNTCIVGPKDSWKEIPSHEKVVKALKKTLQHVEIQDGTHYYAMPHNLFSADLKCRLFNSVGVAVGPEEKGAFKINFERVKGGAKAAMKAVMKDEKFTPHQIKFLKEFFAGVDKPRLFVWKLEHITPVKR